MGEEVTYADLRFHDSGHVSTNNTVEKNPEVASSEQSHHHCRCLKKIHVIIGILICALLLALLAMTILLLQATRTQNDYRGRIQSISQTLANVRNDLCMTSEGQQNGKVRSFCR
ncbi:hypothetical protein GDO81_017091 [Engystomops pustulosus]|uniref:Uncharacterized protein n=1 Tax=Engystomops pustulosus TaxID=76066 RepID=A0AAV7AB22_ENGPU|nr:hypothetical protein GDO81_017091 [Engystomops pustulosus]